MPIQNLNVVLQPFERSDFSRLQSWITTPEALITWCGPFFTYPLDDIQLEAYLETTHLAPPLRRVYKVRLGSNDLGPVFGHIELNNIDLRNEAATLSKVLVCPEMRGKGLARPMVDQILAIAFDEMSLHRVELRVFDFNEPAIRCYQKAGFQIEGHLRDYRKFNDQYWSSYIMSILAPDWRSSHSCPGDNVDESAKPEKPVESSPA